MSNKIFELRIYKVNEKIWVSAPSLLIAIQYLDSEDVSPIFEYDERDEIVELPIEKWSEYKVTNTDKDPEDEEDWSEMTFAQWMNENSQKGIIATTMTE